ncbi:hypothetical protein D9757_012008 [Collybiopsis confluens]|uniref:Major facilitator superfamily (MFS) profile domain-containing protein n=1 Tax=Collybiopsis confluens TaxID=2823264 RepID=A0A8H5GSL8_9AGAR|nr:hypothetical protein D9757_012008 [Collybiopsis confluens]
MKVFDRGSKKPRWTRLSGFMLNACLATACATSMALFGYDQGVFGGIIVTDSFLETMGNPDANLQGTIVSLYDIGSSVLLSIFGKHHPNPLSGAVDGERFGRKKSLGIGVIIMSIGAILQATAFTVAHIIVARLFTGFGTGITTATAPVWQGETSKPDLRGKLVVLSTTALVAGFSLSNWMTYGFSFLKGDVSWRFPIAFQLVFSIILLITIPWLPESPRWLIAHERDREGAEVLAAFQGDGSTFDSPNIVAQKMEILEAVNIEREQSLSWLKILKGQTGNTGMVKRLLLGMGE